VFGGGHVSLDDLVQAEDVPQLPGQPHIAEAASIRPAHLLEANADDIGIVRQSHVVVVRKQPQLLGVALAVVEDDRALPAAFLVVIEFAEVGDRALSRSIGRAFAFDESVVRVFLAVLEALVSSQKHRRPPA